MAFLAPIPSRSAIVGKADLLLPSSNSLAMEAAEADAWARWCPHRFDELPRTAVRRVATRSTTTTATVPITSVEMMAQLTGQYMIRVVCAANDRCRQHKRTTVGTEDILHALK